MPSAQLPVRDNELIERLSTADRLRLLALCEPVDLAFGEILCQPDAPHRGVYFPRSGFISLLATASGHPPLEMGLVGTEGMLGASMALGVEEVPLMAVVQCSGSAWRIEPRSFRRALATSKSLHLAIDRYLYVLMAQLSQSALCARFHEVEPRLARWLLITHDRAHADHFHLTHQFLADMLGVKRSAVTIAAGSLQRRQCIRYSRGEIGILSRSALEAASCECYAAGNRDYSGQFGGAAEIRSQVTPA
jgi:CRP-like cAMP-binding protein